MKPPEPPATTRAGATPKKTHDRSSRSRRLALPEVAAWLERSEAEEAEAPTTDELASLTTSKVEALIRSRLGWTGQARS